MDESKYNKLLQQALYEKPPDDFREAVMDKIQKYPSFAAGKKGNAEIREYWIVAALAMAGVLFVVLMYYRNTLPDMEWAEMAESVFTFAHALSAEKLAALGLGILAAVFWSFVDKFAGWFVTRKLQV